MKINPIWGIQGRIPVDKVYGKSVANLLELYHQPQKPPTILAEVNSSFSGVDGGHIPLHIEFQIVEIQED